MFKVTATFDKLLDKACSLTNLDPDWNSIMQICDCIRQGDVQPKYALSAIKKKLYATNPNVELLALQVLESCVKNCGNPFHVEVTSKAFMDELREMAKVSSDSKVREEVVKLIQLWAHAFRNDSSHKAVQDTLNIMKSEGYKFPALKESDAMFSADSAPDWADGDCCHRCRSQFSLVLRKHHCRHCGQIFCQKCSAKLSIIPKYGIEKEVRVCDDCFDKLNKAAAKQEQSKTATLNDSAPYNSVKTETNKKTDQEIQEEEELQLALALSQSEAETKEKEKRTRSLSASSASPNKPSIKSNSLKKNDSTGKSQSSNDIDDPELTRYLNRDYWEQRALNYQFDDSSSSNPTPSAPQPQQVMTMVSNKGLPNQSNIIKEKILTANDNTDEMDTFLTNLQSVIEIFVNRINSNQLRGRSVTNDTGVQSLFITITNMHSQLLNYLKNQDESRGHYEKLQDKLNQIRDARAALDALREEHREQTRREAEEAERIRQQQMMQKLEIMRNKKQEYLQYQREIALQRMKEQERELLMRQQQQIYNMPATAWQQQQQHQQPQQTSFAGLPYSQPPNASYTNIPYDAIQSTQISQQMPQQSAQTVPQLTQSIPQSVPQQFVQSTQSIAQPIQSSIQQQMPSPAHVHNTYGTNVNTNVSSAQIYQPPVQQVPYMMPQHAQPQQTNMSEFQNYNMHTLANALPVMPQNNQIGPVMTPAVNQHNVYMQQQQQQQQPLHFQTVMNYPIQATQPKNQAEVIEAPLISFD